MQQQTQSPAVRHEGLVRMLANQRFKHLIRPYRDMDDIVYEGLYGILNAESRYSPNKGSEGAYYGTVAIRRIKSRCEQYEAKKMRRGKIIPLHAPAYRGSKMTFADTIPARDDTESVALNRAFLAPFLDRLKRECPREYMVVMMRYYGQMLNREIADELGCSAALASLLAIEGVNNLRKYMEEQQ